MIRGIVQFFVEVWLYEVEMAVKSRICKKRRSREKSYSLFLQTGGLCDALYHSSYELFSISGVWKRRSDTTHQGACLLGGVLSGLVTSI